MSERITIDIGAQYLGGTVRLAALAPTGHRPAVALEITDAGADPEITP